MRLRNLPHNLKTIACFAICLALISGSLLLTGCSTPKNAIVFGDGTKISTGEYLAYLYNSYKTTFYYNGLSNYAQQGVDPWAQKLSYGQGEEAEELSVEDYIVKLTEDYIVRQKAVSDKLSEFKIEISEQDQKTYNDYMTSVSEDTFLPLGFGKDSFGKMYKATTFNENSLFKGLYDKGGKRAMSEKEIKDYYNDNIFTYKIIEISLTDEAGSDLDAEGIKKVKKQLEEYLDLYESNKDFDKTIEKYNADSQAPETPPATTDPSATSPTTATTTTIAATTTTATTTAATTSTAPSEETDDNSDQQNEEPTDSNLRIIDANHDDEDIVKAVKSVNVGQAKVVEYKKNGTDNTAALILRINPEETEHNFDNSRERVIRGAKYEEFDKEIKAYIKTLKYDVKKSVLKKCTPKQLALDEAKTAS
ncbi:MAG: hypothetical protein PHH84_04670 [Oscillospiraceae bacterium]|nr:hypothetical protein [Oscillospiraceae bacterium]MDD4414145.1 hypothetical protein [Oscillospiraceae bacterium]